MASQPIANPTIDWSARNLAHEYKTFTEMCKLMFSGPYKSCGELEQFSYMSLWGGSKTLTLWINSGLTEQTVDNLKKVLKNYCVPDDHQFWANRMENLFWRIFSRFFNSRHLASRCMPMV